MTGLRHYDAGLAVETRALTKRYGDLVAVEGLDLRVRRGEVYGFLGPNGGREFLLLRAAPLERAAALLASTRGVEGVERVDGRLRVAAGAVPAHEINRALVAAGIRVTELRPERTSLEDVFFELTREEVDR